jgi:hypothetical protein
MRATHYQSVGGITGRVRFDDTPITYLIVEHNAEKPLICLEVDYKKNLIKIYDNNNWTILPMDADQQFNPATRIISNIDELKRKS